MIRKQRTCLVVGFLLILLSLLFPPFTIQHPASRLGGFYSGASNSTSYGFLFRTSGTVELSRLFVEWVLIALVTSALFFSQRKPRTLGAAGSNDPLAAAGPSTLEGGSYFKVDYPGLAREFIAHVDDLNRVTLWERGQQPAQTGLTSDQLETYGVKFKIATEEAIRAGLENPKTYRSLKLWLRKFKIPIVVALAILTVGVGYYVSRRIVRDLPPAEVSKLDGRASITNYGAFLCNAYNGSDFVLAEVRVSISLFDEKTNALISKRVYRVPAYDFYPQQTKQLSVDVGFTLAQDQRWEWLIVGAKGRPEQVFSLGLYKSHETGKARTSQAETMPVTVSRVEQPEEASGRTWLDEPLKDWNGLGSELPENTWSLRGLSPECEPQTRLPHNEVEKALRDKGWFFVDANLPPILNDARYPDITVVEAVAGFGGMCRAEPLQAFVFYQGKFVGTLEPVLSFEDVTLSVIRISGFLTLQAEFLTYLPRDGRCCPSLKRSVSYEIQGNFVLRAVAVARIS